MSNSASKIHRPMAKCMDCHAFFDDEYINKTCPACKESIVRSEYRTNTLFECQGCNGTGVYSSSVCNWCKGKGWLFTEFFQKPSNL